MSSLDQLDLFASYLCLVYHEARNVRHLIRDGYLESGPYLRVQSLPTNRNAAWGDMQVLRTQASGSGNAAEASDVFARRFRLTLEELVDLYEDRHWRDALYGGNRWSGITQSVLELRDALDRDDAKTATDLLTQIPTMSHNTGQVEEKLRGLDAAL
jgi:hypothetical protein